MYIKSVKYLDILPYIYKTLDIVCSFVNTINVIK